MAEGGKGRGVFRGSNMFSALAEHFSAADQEVFAMNAVRKRFHAKRVGVAPADSQGRAARGEPRPSTPGEEDRQQEFHEEHDSRGRGEARTALEQEPAEADLQFPA